MIRTVQRRPQILLALHIISAERPHPLDMKARSEVDQLIRRDGLITTHPSLANTIAWLVRQGKLVPVLPVSMRRLRLLATSRSSYVL